MVFLFFFNDTATTEIYTLSLHDALPISLDLSPGSADTYDLYGRMLSALVRHDEAIAMVRRAQELDPLAHRTDVASTRSEEHTSELQSQSNLVCRLLLEKKKNNSASYISH